MLRARASSPLAVLAPPRGVAEEGKVSAGSVGVARGVAEEGVDSTGGVVVTPRVGHEGV